MIADAKVLAFASAKAPAFASAKAPAFRYTGDFTSTANPMKRLTSRFTFLYILLFSACLGATLPAQAQERMALAKLSIGLHLITAEVAATPQQRQQGLMFREKMGRNEGMIFLFGQPAGVCMWMKNTPLPLSVAFIDSAGTIVNIEDMEPHSTESHCADREVPYALEMHKGWFKQRNIQPGATVSGLPGVN